MSVIIARYVELFLWQADTDLAMFSAHSASSVLTSKGNNLGLTLDDIPKVGWLENK